MLRFLSRLLIALVVIAAVVALAVAAFRFLVAPRAFPQVDGTLTLAGLDASVDIYRDSFGIPHIYASTEHDLLMANGFVQAQDRFWQMEFQRRVPTGRLSEILGEGTLDTDRYFRTIGLHRAASVEADLLEGEDLEALNAYAEGVNAYLETHSGPKGLEFTILGLQGTRFEPEQWSPFDTLVSGKLLAWFLRSNADQELARANIAARLGTPAVEVLMPAYDPEQPFIVSNTLAESTLESVPDIAFSRYPWASGQGLGSNSAVVSGERTTTGAPLLANDPHLDIQMPSIWYEVGLHCRPVGPECVLNVVGASFPGVPGVLIGHNERIAWGFTYLVGDHEDYFIERLNPENPNQYEFRGEWLDLEIVREEIEVEGQDEPVIVDVRKTRHGPIINDVAGGLEQDWSYGWEPLAYSWTALEPGTIHKTFLRLNRAQNWDEFRDALQYLDVAGQNAVYADVDGNIGYQATGRYPIRARGNGTMPVPGWTGEFEWTDFIPYQELPSAFNPPEGYIATANNAVVGPDYPYFLSVDWDRGYRARRLVELLEADDSVSVQDMQTIQRDSNSLYAQDILPHFLSLQLSDSVQRQALDILRVWDGREDRDSAGAAIFETLRLRLIENMFADELGDQLMGRASGQSIFQAARNLLDEPDSIWFDDTRTVEIELRDDILLQSLEETVDELSDALGNKPADWRWGDLHQASFENQTLGQSGIPPIEWIFNRGPYEVDGGLETLFRSRYDINEPFGVTGLSSYLQIVDLGDMSRSLSIHTTGQSGHPFNPHYDDMIDPWRNHQYHSMLWTRGQVEAGAESYLQLMP
ncbi:MAG: penicillin acylase family protein [Anaerolineae bacterium]|nr:MAG: penicillin acylase family protein [Anaerolineae bacterium]